MTDFARTHQMFDIPEGMIYLNGHSFGPVPKADVIGDFRADIRTAVDRLDEILRDGVWKQDEFQVRSLVT